MASPITFLNGRSKQKCARRGAFLLGLWRRGCPPNAQLKCALQPHQGLSSTIRPTKGLTDCVGSKRARSKVESPSGPYPSRPVAAVQRSHCPRIRRTRGKKMPSARAGRVDERQKREGGGEARSPRRSCRRDASVAGLLQSSADEPPSCWKRGWSRPSGQPVGAY